jgi:hypothetical protein
MIAFKSGRVRDAFVKACLQNDVLTNKITNLPEAITIVDLKDGHIHLVAESNEGAVLAALNEGLKRPLAYSVPGSGIHYQVPAQDRSTVS